MVLYIKKSLYDGWEDGRYVRRWKMSEKIEDR